MRAALEHAEKDVPRTENDSAEARRANALELIVRSYLAGNEERGPTEVVIHVDDEQIQSGDISPAVERHVHHLDHYITGGPRALGEQLDRHLAVGTLFEMFRPTFNARN